MRRNKLLVMVLIALTLTLGLSLTACDTPETIPQQYTVTVTGGSGGGTFDDGADCTLTATVPSGKTFAKWTVDGTQVSTANPYTFTVTKDVAVVAVFADVIAQYSVTVDGEIINSTAKAGDTITLTRPSGQTGKTFSWTVVSGGVTITDDAFTMPADNVVITSGFTNITYTLTVNNATFTGTAQYGETITLSPTVPQYKKFASWTVVSGGVTITDNVFTMPASNVEITANFEDITYTVTVVDGTIDDETSLSVVVNTQKTVIANTRAGYEFTKWTVGGTQVSALESYTFTVTDNVTVVANFVKLEQDIAKPDNTENKLFFREGGGSIAIDRAANTLFGDATDYVKVWLYAAGSDTAAGSFKIALDPESTSAQNAGWVMSNDGTNKITMKGSAGNLFIEGYAYNDFLNIIKSACGMAWGEGKTFFVALQVIAVSETVAVDGVDVAFSDSEISNKDSIGFCKDSTKPSADYTIKIIDGNVTTTETAGYGVTFTYTTEDKDGFTFSGWYFITYDEHEEEVVGELMTAFLSFNLTVTESITLKAIFIDDSEVVKTPIATPDNSENKLFYAEGDSEGSAVAFDRVSTSKMFTAATQYVKIWIYSASDAEADEHIGSFKIALDPTSTDKQKAGWVMSMDETIKITMMGDPVDGFYFFNVGEVHKIIKYELGYAYSEAATYYLAVQIIAVENSVYEDSEISLISTVGFVKNSGAPAGMFTVTAVDGIIDIEEQTTVQAGYGVSVTFIAEVPEDKYFAGWKCNMGGDVGNIVSYRYEYTVKITGNLTLEAVFVDKTEGKIKLDAPDNSTNQMIGFPGAIEFDRQKEENGDRKTAFATGVDYIKYVVYTSDEAEAVAVAEFKMYIGGDGNGYISKMDGSNAFRLSGEPGNFYGDQGHAHNALKPLIAGYSDGNGLTYYFAAQAIAYENTVYEDSDIGAIGSGRAGI